MVGRGTDIKLVKGATEASTVAWARASGPDPAELLPVDPIPILDLAKNLLRLMGSLGKTGRDLIFTGLRPGEKLHEELVALGEQAVASPTPKVRLMTKESEAPAGLRESLAKIEEGDFTGAGGAILPLLRVVTHKLGVV